MPLIIFSRSTEDFARKMDGDFLKVDRPPTKKTFDLKADSEIIAIGGGSVIDTAKIIAKNSGNKKIIAVPTTASGAVETSHAVYWNGRRKYSVRTPMPTSKINPSLLRTLPKNVIVATSYDALSQALESYWSKKATNTSRMFARRSAEMVAEQIKNNYPDLEKLIEGGNLSGKAIEITGTNIAHALSYPMTGFYGVPHGLAVGLVLSAVAKYIGCEFEIPEYKIELKRKLDIGLIASEAITYTQIHNAIKDINKERVIKILEESL